MCYHECVYNVADESNNNDETLKDACVYIVYHPGMLDEMQRFNINMTNSKNRWRCIIQRFIHMKEKVTFHNTFTKWKWKNEAALIDLQMFCK